ncbi:sensor histidine kinase [Microbacterium gorillae]|uniref:sensor histidine kinase n=1 Tax=Microbacterium gorillae TaxID=1231063 RepID=UPI000A64272D|nr:HAMP domain-containing sensor histidine kinase [Microbacterium gorillae]
MPFLQQRFIEQIDDSLKQSSASDLVSQLFDVTKTSESSVTISALAPVSGTNPPYVALYKQDGSLGATGGRSDGMQPQFPTQMRPDKVAQQSIDAFWLPDADGDITAFRATVSSVPITLGDRSTLVYLVVALPASQVESNIGAYLTIYLALAALTVLAAALLTRWVVTLAFRRLGQVESTAMAIAAGNFSQRMPGAEPRTEVGRLKLAINTMLGRLDAAIDQRDTTVQQMRRFIGDASHELRTPLVTVRGYAELYRMGAIRGEDDTAQAMERIEKEAIRMTTLVEDLLALARLDERRDIVFAAVDLRPIARDAAMDVRAAAPDRTGTFIDTTASPVPAARDAAIVAEEQPDAAGRRRAPGTAAIASLGRRLVRRRATDTGPTELTPQTAPMPAVPPIVPEPIVSGQEDKIRQVVTNLVGNARRYTPNDSPIEIAVGVDDAHEHGWIAVIDHGEGIPEQLRGRIFERFWRADTSRTRETGGSGLGLSIVASIVDSLHGTIAVAETPGGGATFRVSFPLLSARDPQDHLAIPTQPLQRLALDEDGAPIRPDIATA